MADETREEILIEIRDLLREQNRVAEASVERAMRFQKVSLLWAGGIGAVVISIVFLWAWDWRLRTIKASELNEEAIRLHIEAEKHAIQQMEHQPDGQGQP